MDHPTLGRKLEILLAEDSRIDARLTINALRRSRLRHRLTLVRDGAEAIAFLKREGVFRRAPLPDIILLDLVLPKRDGWDVLRVRAEDPVLRPIPVIVLTACDNAKELQSCQDLGIDELLKKPVQVERFLAAVRELKRRLQSNWQLPDEPPVSAPAGAVRASGSPTERTLPVGGQRP